MKSVTSTQIPQLNIASADTAEKLKKKIGQVALAEKELEIMRFAAEIGYPHIDLEKFPVSAQALRLLPRDEAERLGAVCFFSTQDEIRLGALDPRAPGVADALDRLEAVNHAHGALYVISEKSFERMRRLYDTLPTVRPVTKDIAVSAEALDQVLADVGDWRGLQPLIDAKRTSDVLTFLLGAGLKTGASDIHVEAEESGIVVRFRLDGMLHDVAALPVESYKKLVSRIKLVSTLKINITSTPQDGRFTIKVAEGDVDVRVSTMPTVFGESIVMRILRQSLRGLSLDQIGLYGDAYDKLKREIERPNGMIITTGPTGSGKTTTMYALLQILNEPGVKIITLEDPVEYRMVGVNQSQIDKSKDYTFAKGLRSILRQDPDIAMVGEIRDLETADIAIQAALTGHLILSTIHTNSASGAIPRFLSMGVKPFLLAPALNCVIGQRLVRRLCEVCKKKIVLPNEVLKRVEDILSRLSESAAAAVAEKPKVFFTAVGCNACHGFGYKGRIGIYEIFIMNETVEQMILAGQISEFDLEKVATLNGMVTMAQDGLLKALGGVTSVEEVFRVIE